MRSSSSSSRLGGLTMKGSHRGVEIIGKSNRFITGLSFILTMCRKRRIRVNGLFVRFNRWSYEGVLGLGNRGMKGWRALMCLIMGLEIENFVY